MFSLTKRAAGASLTTAAHLIDNLVVSLLVPVLFRKIWFGIYIMFGIFCIIMGLLAFFFYPETKGVHLEKMDRLFRGSIFAYSRPNAELIGYINQEDDETI